MHKIVRTFTRNGIFTSLLAGTIAFVLGFALLDQWAFDEMHSHSISKGMALLPLTLTTCILFGFLVETLSLCHDLAFCKSIKPWLLNYKRVFAGFFGGLLVGMTVAAIAMFFQEFLRTILGMMMFWR